MGRSQDVYDCILRDLHDYHILNPNPTDEQITEHFEEVVWLVGARRFMSTEIILEHPIFPHMNPTTDDEISNINHFNAYIDYVGRLCYYSEATKDGYRWDDDDQPITDALNECFQELDILCEEWNLTIYELLDLIKIHHPLAYPLILSHITDLDSDIRANERCKIIKEELIMRTWHPSRVEKLLLMGYDIEDM